MWAALRRQECLPHVCVFSLRLENASGECFVGVAGISNNFQLRLEMAVAEGKGKGCPVKALR
jgi:hypothetical protein